MIKGINFKEIDKSLEESFSPHLPINKAEFLAGRKKIIKNVVTALRTRGLHIILWGQRGTGKTSIAQVITDTINHEIPKTYSAFLISCNSRGNFSQIWQSVAHNILLMQSQIGFTQQNVKIVTGTLELDSSIKAPEQVKLFIESLPNPCLVIIDEFDRIKSHSQTQSLLADTIKLFSDRDISSKIMIVGVAEDVNDLFQHKSISRCSAQIEVRPMYIPELKEIIHKGYSNSRMTFEKGIDKKIAELSQGYPHYTHLLGKWAGKVALKNKRTHVTFSDLTAAIPKAIENAAAGLLTEYEKAVQSSQKNALFKDVLLACAISKKSVLGKFSMIDIKEPLCNITGKNYEPAAYQSHLAKFCTKERGPVLKRTGTRYNYKWQFINPQLIPFIILKGINEKRIKYTEYSKL